MYLKKKLNNRGVALIVVVLMVSVITALTIEFNRSTRDELYDAANLSGRIQLSYVARSGFYGGEALLITDVNGYDGLNENWAKTGLFSLQSEGYFKKGSFEVVVTDETGKIPINKLISGNTYNAPVKDLLVRLLSLPEFNLAPAKIDELVDSIKDWLDADDEVTGKGAESSYYRGLTPPYSPRNGFLDCIDDLLMLRGVTKELYYGTKETPALRDCLTVYGDGAININTAPKLVLRALSKDITAEMAEEMDKYRRTEGRSLADVNWYRNVQGMQSIAMEYGVLSAKSSYYTITSTGLFGNMKERVTGTIKKGQAPGTADLLAWKVE